jgi:hypothetical protein
MQHISFIRHRRLHILTAGSCVLNIPSAFFGILVWQEGSFVHQQFVELCFELLLGAVSVPRRISQLSLLT